jgi:hypothetical protein
MEIKNAAIYNYNSNSVKVQVNSLSIYEQFVTVTEKAVTTFLAVSAKKTYTKTAA